MNHIPYRGHASLSQIFFWLVLAVILAGLAVALD
jgi:hypothetical protein